MKLEGLNILLISPEPWEHLFVSKHHYATHLGALGNKVYFLGPPEQQYSIKETNYPNVWRLGYKGFIKGLRFLPAKIQRWLIRKGFERLQTLAKVSFDIVWSFDNSVFYDFSALPNKVYCISHIVDLNQNFQLAKAAQTATICFGVTDSIVSLLKQSNPNTHFINHGLNLNYKEFHVEDFPGNNLLKGLYLGNLDMAYLDWKTLYFAIKNTPNVDFIFIGANGTQFNSTNETIVYKHKIIKLNNVYFLDRIPPEYIQSYLRKSDFLFLCYQERHHEDQANPHKILEYIYSGKPIVATFTKQYINTTYIHMSHLNKDWSNILTSTINNIAPKNDVKKHDLLEYALSNSYENQILKISSLI